MMQQDQASAAERTHRGECTMAKWGGWLLALVWTLTCSTAHVAAQQAFPTHTVRILVPYPAGGAVDVVARTLGDELSRTWGQPVIIENKPGAGGVVASQSLAASPKDGYSLIVVASGHATNPYLYKQLPYDTFTDFTPIAKLASAPNMIIVRADSAYKTLADLLSAARSNPGSLSYGHAGVGTSAHLAGEMLKYLAKVDIVGVPYRGGAPALNDLLAGQIPLSVNNAPEALAHIRAGTVRALGVTTAGRATFLPDVPAIAEAGVPGYATDVWWGLLGPAGMPADVTAKINGDCAAALKSAAVRLRLEQLGATAAGGSADDLARIIRADYETWGPVIKAAGVVPQ